MKRLTDPTFKYIPAAKTNLRLTFARLRREQRESDAKRAPVVATIGKKGAK